MGSVNFPFTPKSYKMYSQLPSAVRGISQLPLIYTSGPAASSAMFGCKHNCFLPRVRTNRRHDSNCSVGRIALVDDFPRHEVTQYTSTLRCQNAALSNEVEDVRLVGSVLMSRTISRHSALEPFRCPNWRARKRPLIFLAVHATEPSSWLDVLADIVGIYEITHP